MEIQKHMGGSIYRGGRHTNTWGFAVWVQGTGHCGNTLEGPWRVEGEGNVRDDLGGLCGGSGFGDSALGLEAYKAFQASWMLAPWCMNLGGIRLEEKEEVGSFVVAWAWNDGGLTLAVGMGRHWEVRCEVFTDWLDVNDGASFGMTPRGLTQ